MPNRTILFFFLLPLYLFAEYSPQSIAYELKSASVRHDIDMRVLYTLAKIESQFNPLVISFISKDKNYSFNNLDKKVRKYKNSYIINFFGDEEDLKNALKVLMNKKLKVDVGLMPINSVYFTSDEIDKIFKLEYNIDKSSKILKQCINIKKQLKDSIECYNKGIKKPVEYSYFNRFKTNFNKDFAYE